PDRDLADSSTAEESIALHGYRVGPRLARELREPIERGAQIGSGLGEQRHRELDVLRTGHALTIAGRGPATKAFFAVDGADRRPARARALSRLQRLRALETFSRSARAV